METKQISKQRQKELKQRYKEMKTPMGAFIIRNSINGKVFMDVSHDIKSTFNSFRFQLGIGSLRIRELQRDWNSFGEEAFEFEVLEHLEYDENEAKTDYREELEIMKMLWLEKLSENEKIQLYKK